MVEGPTHRLLKQAIADFLSKSGYSVQTEKHEQGRRIDIVASKGSHDVRVEVVRTHTPPWFKVMIDNEIAPWANSQVPNQSGYQVSIRLEPQLRDALWKLLKRKYSGSLYGALNAEFHEMIRYWLKLAGETVGSHTNSKFPRRHNIAQDIIFDLKNHGCLKQCSVTDLRQSIQRVRGVDERTLRTWHRFLVSNHYVKSLSAQIYEIL